MLLLLCLLHLERLLPRDDDTLESAEPARETFLVRRAEAIDWSVFCDDLEAEVLGSRDGVDFGGVDDLGHGYDLDGGVFLGNELARIYQGM